MTLKVNEIFYSIQGETTTAGFPSLFVRLTGCNLHCKYCDTEYARNSGKILSIPKILQEIKKYPQVNHITLTGGEPLLQKNSIKLIDEIINMGLNIQIETNGSINLKDVNKKARKIIDIKTPASGEGESFLLENINYATKIDEYKFVISDMTDYKFTINFIKQNLIETPAIINLSPEEKKMSPLKLSELILRDKLPVRLNLQLHKIVGLETEIEKKGISIKE